jgi:hypothetical protein
MKTRPASITPDIDRFLESEARKRRVCLTSSQIAEATGLTKTYVTQRMSYLRRKVEVTLHVEPSQKCESESSHDSQKAQGEKL